MSTDLRAKWSEVAALTSAGTVAATIFCCLPFATGIVGASVAAFGARFAPFQPYLICTSLALLAYSFYQAYRPDPTCAADSCDAPASVRRTLSPAAPGLSFRLGVVLLEPRVDQHHGGAELRAGVAAP